MTEDAV